MIIKTERFGQLSIKDNEIVFIPQGLLGFPEDRKFCLVDLADETLILWLQSLENPATAFPVLEPKIFKPDYSVRLSGAEFRELNLENINQSAVFSILTIPQDISRMTANLKAPLVVNLTTQTGKQVVLQENEYKVQHEIFKDLRAHLLTAKSNRHILQPGAHQNSQKSSTATPLGDNEEQLSTASPVAIQTIPPSLVVKPLL